MPNNGFKRDILQNSPKFFQGEKMFRSSIKFLSVFIMSIFVIATFTGCGGGGSSSSTPVAPVEPLYSTIQDLEFKTLNMKDIWYHDGSSGAILTIMKFTNNYAYGSDGLPVLLDNTSSAYFAKGCAEAPPGGVGPNGEVLRYLCMGVFASGGVAGWGVAINNAGIISGNFHYSDIGDAGAVGVAVKNPSTAYAYLEGGVSNTVATSNVTIASADGAGNVSEISESNIDDDINREKSYSELTSNIVQSTTMQQVDPEITQAINELYEALLQVQSEK